MTTDTFFRNDTGKATTKPIPQLSKHLPCCPLLLNEISVFLFLSLSTSSLLPSPSPTHTPKAKDLSLGVYATEYLKDLIHSPPNETTDVCSLPPSTLIQSHKLPRVKVRTVEPCHKTTVHHASPWWSP